MRPIHLAVPALAVTMACAHQAPSLAERVEVTPTGSAVELAPRAAECAIPFLRTKPPERAYDEIAVLHLDVFGDFDAATVHAALRARACAVGADAVVVTREYATGNFTGMAVVAVSYPELRPQHRAEWTAAQEEAARAREREQAAIARSRAEMARVARTMSRSQSVPADFVPAKALRHLVVRGTPDRSGAERDTVMAGTLVWASPGAPSGWRRVWIQGGGFGWVEETDLGPASLTAPQPAAGTPGARPPGT